MPEDVKAQDSKATMVVMNCGPSKVGTSKGILGPGDSVELPLAEAKKLLKYHDIKDAALKVPAHADEIGRLKAENAELLGKVKGLQKQLDSMAPKAKEEPKVEKPAAAPAIEKPKEEQKASKGKGK